MYNPDQHYEAHALHLKDLYIEAEQSRMNAALPQHRHTWLHPAGGQLGVVAMRLSTWLARGAQRDRRPA